MGSSTAFLKRGLSCLVFSRASSLAQSAVAAAQASATATAQFSQLGLPSTSDVLSYAQKNSTSGFCVSSAMQNTLLTPISVLRWHGSCQTKSFIPPGQNTKIRSSLLPRSRNRILPLHVLLSPLRQKMLQLPLLL